MIRSSALKFEEDIPDPIEFAEEIYLAKQRMAKLPEEGTGLNKSRYSTFFLLAFLYAAAMLLIILN